MDNSTNKKDKKDKRNKKNKKAWPLYALLAASIVAVAIFSVLLGRELYTNWQSQSFYSELSSDIETRPQATAAPRPSPTPGGTGAEDAGSGDSAPDEQEDAAFVPYMDFEALGEKFPGVVGWIKLEGTAIDYPIMHWTDNDYFLGHLPDGTSHRSGSIFLDYRNSPDFMDKSILIYGHASRTQEMFGSLKNYRGQEYYDAHPHAYIYTPERDYALLFIAGYLVDSGTETPPMSFKDEEAFLKHIDDIKRRSFFRSDVVVGPDDRIVNLCTCAYDFDNARLILVGKLVEI